MAVRNTKTSQMRAQQRRTQKLEAAAPTGFSSVTRGQFRVASEEGLLVEGSQRVSGRLFVTGYEEVGGQLRVTGSLVVSGNADVTGPMDVRGPLTVRGSTTFVGPLRIEGSAAIVGPLRIEGKVDVVGPFTVSGPMDITGDLTITGKTTVTGDLDINGKSRFTGDLSIEGSTKMRGDVEVVDDGRVRVGGLVLDPKGGENGLGSISSETIIELQSPTVYVRTALFVKRGATFEGGMDVPGLQLKAGAAGNLHVDGNGRLWRTA